MSTQFKLDQTSKPEQNKKIIDQHLNKRPNIDHLLKKISLERKEEKKNNIFMLALGIIVIGLVSVVIV
jgi:hypothetical protein|tara:strand:+ start:124 stop:327 length:204 start_codon:yes stop_codon:yes gene_type:complete